MDQVWMPVDQTLGLLYRTGWRRPGLIFNDRGIDLEGVAGLLSADELLKLEEILVQVRSQFCHRGQDQECNQRENTDRAVYLKNQRHHLAPGLSVLMPIGNMTGFKLVYYPIQMDVLSNKDVEVLVPVYLRCSLIGLPFCLQLDGCAA
jgi:hypothetical protein